MKNQRLIKDKKADIPITLLVLGVFLVCIFVITSFYLSDKKTERFFVGTGLIEEMNSEIEKYYFYQNIPDFREDEIRKIMNISIDAVGEKYLYLEKYAKRNPGFGKEEKVISVRYYLP
jgi:hypothetical protein